MATSRRILIGCMLAVGVIAIAWALYGTRETGQTAEEARRGPMAARTSGSERNAIPSSKPSDLQSDTKHSELDLNAFIASLNPPTVEETIKSLEPIPTLEEALAPLPEKPDAPYRKNLPDEEKKHVEELEKQIQKLREQAKYGDALPLAEEILQIRRGAQGETWWETTDSIRLAGTLKIIVQLTPEAQREIANADAADMQGESLYNTGKFKAAGDLVCRQLEIRKRVLGNEHPDVAECLNNLAVLRYNKGDYVGAEPLYREALAMRRKLLGDEHPIVAATFDDLAWFLYAKGDFAAAGALYREALAMRRKLLGDEHKDVAQSLNGLALLLDAKGDYSAAELLFGQALAMRRKLLGNEHADVAQSLNNLAALLHAKCNYAAAEPLYREALAMHRKLLGEEHWDVALSLNNMAVLLYDKGDHVAAEPLYREALAMRRKLLGDEHPDVAHSLADLAALLDAKGDYIAAEPLFRNSLAIRRRVLGNEHPDVADTLTSLAALHWAKGDFAAAEPLFREALAMRRKLLGDEHPDVATSLNNLAVLLKSKDDYVAAEPLFRDSLAMCRRLLGSKHPNVASSLSNLTDVLGAEGRYSEAEPFAVDAAAVFETSRIRVSASGLGRVAAQSSPYPNLTVLRARLGKPMEALQSLERTFARAITDELSARLVRPLSDDERHRESNLLRRLSKQEEHLAAAQGKKELSEKEKPKLRDLRAEYDALQAEYSSFEQAITEKYGPAAGEVYDLDKIQNGLPSDAALLAWLDIKGHPKAVDPNGDHWACVVRHEGEPKWVKLPGSGAEGAWTEEDDALPSRVVELLGREIVEALPPALATPERIEEVCKEAAVRFVNRRLVTRRRVVSAQREVLRKQSEDPLWTKTVEAFCERSAKIADWENLQAQLKSLAAQRLDPVRPHLESVKKLVVLPAGWMSGVPVESLTDELVVSYAPSGTMYTWLTEKGQEAKKRRQDEAASAATILALGNPVFERPNQLAKASSTPPGDATRARSNLDDILSDLTRGERWQPLWHTQDELLGIRNIFESASHKRPPAEPRAPSSLFLERSEASERKLDGLAQSGGLARFRYLHFATHGAMDDQVAMRSALILSQDDISEDENFERAIEGKDVYDGRLTADQIVKTWKLDADLVTLSACKTALGKQAAGEGYLGFSQAFFVAGAQSLVLSLWEVDDEATSLLMQRFYENLLGTYSESRGSFPAGEPMPKAEALAEAKRWVRGLSAAECLRLQAQAAQRTRGAQDEAAPSDTRGEESSQADKDFSDPYYWAGFVLIGARE